ncbi:MAG: DUF6249 domain-containing protein [Candidatus Zixiibacteriota bacterium]
MANLNEVLIPIVVFAGFAFIIKIILDHSTRGKLINKGMVDESVKFLYLGKPEGQIASSLKWGMVAIGVGLAIFIGQMVRPSLQEEVTIGCMFLFGGIGLVIHYAITRKTLERSRKENSGPPVP